MSDSKKTTSDVLEIRRYSNRRFYDPSQSKHVTLEEIRDLVRSGRDIRVTDASTGEDITSRTLTQIILEHDDRKVAALPVAMLHRLIRSSESVWAQFMEQYFASAARLFEDSQQAASGQWRRLAEAAPVSDELKRWWQTAWGEAPPPWSQPGSGKAAAGDEPGSPREQELARVVEELREQLDRVQADLGALRNEAWPKPGAKSSGGKGNRGKK